MNIDKALKADVDKNVCIYEEFGFKVVSESEIFNVKIDIC
jgi:hypothetical protein